MPSPFQALDTASTAMFAYQNALSVVSNNISNVNSAGYTRETTTFIENPATSINDSATIKVGNGVNIGTVTSMRDQMLATQRNGISSQLGQSSTLLASSQQIQSSFQEPGTSGISNALDGFFNAWSALASNPSSSGSLTQVQNSGQVLTDRIRGTYQSLGTQTTQTASQIASTIGQIQTDANTIASLNTKIAGANTTGLPPNDLIDQRNQAISDLSNLVDINVNQTNSGQILINVNQFPLVGSGGAATFPTSFNAATMQVTDASGSYDVRGGQLSGLLKTSQSITTYQTQLDNIANTLRTSVNDIHKTGINGLGATGQNFFNDSNPQTGAINFNLDPAVAANPMAIATGVSGAQGDGGLALNIANIATTAQASLGNTSVNSYYQGLVSSVGSAVTGYQTQNTNQTALAQQVDTQIQSVSGVNVDEEMTNMLKFQQSYQMAAKALSIADQTMQTLVSMVI